MWIFYSSYKNPFLSFFFGILILKEHSVFDKNPVSLGAYCASKPKTLVSLLETLFISF